MPGGLQINQDISRRKGMYFLLIFIIMGVPRREMKLKELVKLGGLYTILTKERSLDLKGQEIMKWWGNLWVD